ncbi:MAG: glycosyl hydrolase [Chitinophagaceae bacterium]|nr:glycosyl hydrolase [Oligoflexus sp.]
MKISLCGLLLSSFLVASCGQNNASDSEQASTDADLQLAPSTHRFQKSWATDAARQLQTYYGDNALWNSGWWQSANALTAVADFMRLSGNRDYLWVIDKTFDAYKNNGFMNEYFDDNGWWGLAWIRAYDLTGDWKYMDAAMKIADDMEATGWDSTCNGGVWWNRSKESKNAVENELFIKLTAAIHNRKAGDDQYLALSKKAWSWFFASGLVDDRSVVSDKLVNCQKEQNSPAWTYNQGIILGGAVELYKATNDTAYLSQAQKVAYGTIQYGSSNGILTEATDGSCGGCNGDERLFKGVFMRNLREFYAVKRDPVVANYLQSNAETAWNHARSSDNFYGFHWNSGIDSKDAGRQTSALDLMNGLFAL